jgi:hypothetical protein
MSGDEGLSREQDLIRLEELIRDAGSVLAPGADLRPRIMEAAERHGLWKQQRLRLAGWLGGILLATYIAAPSGAWLEKTNTTRQPAPSRDVYQLATKLAAEAGCHPSWALVEAFQRCRPLAPGVTAARRTRNSL